MIRPRCFAPLLVLLVLAVPLTAQLPVITNFGSPDAVPLPFGAQPTLVWDVADAERVEIGPGVGAVGPSGSVTVAAAGWVAVVGAGEAWRFSDTGDDLGPSDQLAAPTAWFHPAFDDSQWLTGATPLGYLNDTSSATTPTDQSRDLRYGPLPSEDPVHPNKWNDPANKFATYYFRKTFDVAASRLAEIRSLLVSLRRDDGAIAYLNGVEIIRHNLPAGTVRHDTLASAPAVGGNEFNTLFRTEVPAALLAMGKNVLAVEVHQAARNSSDIIMDARVDVLIAPGVQTILPRGSVWKYLDDGSDLGVGWRAPVFNDSAWSEGPGVLGYNNNTNNASGTAAGANTLASFGTDPANKPITIWFRKEFLVQDAASMIDFGLAANYDDGMVVYLNGVEIARAHMPAGPVQATTLALNHEGDYALPFLQPGTSIVLADAGTIAAALVEGPNMLAVQLHQAAANSSDASFNLAMVATDSQTLATRVLVPPFARWAYLDTGEDLGTHGDGGLNPNPWVTLAYDDSAWKRGHAEIGYGDPNDGRAPRTSLDHGPDLQSKTITAYFRRSVTIPNPSSFASYTLEVYRDDAAAVYINGSEVYRDPNLPADAAFDIRATSTVNATVSVVLPATVFQAGDNVVAVEVHQESPTSSDLFFDLALHGNTGGLASTFTLTGTNAAGTVTQHLTIPFAARPGSPVQLMTSLSGGVSGEPGWNHPAIWHDQRPPGMDRAYAVTGSFARVLATGEGPRHSVFAGGALTLGPRAILVHNGGDGVTATCPMLVLAGGEIQSSHNGAAGSLQWRRLAGTIQVASASSLNPSGPNRLLEIAAHLSGRGTLSVAGNVGADPNLPSGVVVSGNNTGFTGDWDVTTINFLPASATALGGTAAEPNTLRMRSGSVMVPQTAVTAPHTTAILNNTGGNNPARLALTHSLQFKSVVLLNTAMPNGTYSFASLSPSDQAFFLDGPGQLIIGENAPDDQDGDGLPDAWELTHFASLEFAAADDPDGDGYHNEAEFKLGTDPADGASQYRFTGPSVVEVAGAPAVRLVFPAQPAWVLQPQWTISLTHGQWLNLGPPLTGAASYVVDDTGAVTGGVPPFTSTSPRRFYRARLFVP